MSLNGQKYHYHINIIYFKIRMDRLHVTSRWPYCGVQTMERRPCWCTRKIMWVLNFILKNRPPSKRRRINIFFYMYDN